MEAMNNTLNLDYRETKKVPAIYKLVAFVLIVKYIFMPMYEVLTQFTPTEFVGVWGCQPFFNT